MMLQALCVAVLLAGSAMAWGAGEATTAPADWVTVKVKRLGDKPIITPEMFKDRKEGANINGPTLLRVPAWIKNPLGKYYLYFGNHRGTYIRLAYADALVGPWKLHEGGVLSLEQLPVKMDHIASPEILVDDAGKRLIMYYHGTPRDKEAAPAGTPMKLDNPGRWSGQLSFASTSADGLTFAPRPQVMSSFYLRVFAYGGKFYGVCKDNNISSQLGRTGDPLTALAKGPAVFPGSRHVALLPQGDTLWVFFSRVGEAPEHIYMTRFDLKEDWTRWGSSAPPAVSVIKPEKLWEGTNYALKPSESGPSVHVQELRDPFVFVEDGKIYLLYSVAGEMGIALAELEFVPKEKGPQAGK